MSNNKLNIDHLSENECAQMVGVLERDLMVRSRERTRLTSEEVKSVAGKPPLVPRHHRHAECNTDVSLATPAGLSTQLYTLQDSLECYTGLNSNRHIVENSRRGSHTNYTTNTDSYPSTSRTPHISTSHEYPTNPRCCRQCGALFSGKNRRQSAHCLICNHWICKLCALWQPKHHGYICGQHLDEDLQQEYKRANSYVHHSSLNGKYLSSYNGDMSKLVQHKFSQSDDIPPLSLDDFTQSMETLVPKPLGVHSDTSMTPHAHVTNSAPVSGAIELQGSLKIPSALPESAATSADLLNVEIFFKPEGGRGENILSGELGALTGYPERDGDEFSRSQSGPAEICGFDELREEETKRFFIELTECVKRLKENVNLSDSESHVEEVLTKHKAVVSAMVANLDHSLHLAVDRQQSGSRKLVKHDQVTSIICSIVEDFIGEGIAESEVVEEGEIICDELAECILSQVLYGEDSQDASPVPEFTLYQKKSTRSSTSYSDDYKFPSFDINWNSLDVDPDLVSLGQGQTTMLPQEDEEVMSEESEPWDSESIISATSANWIFRGKTLTFDDLSLSGKSSLFNANSTSEESVNVLCVPQAMNDEHMTTTVGIRDRLFDGSSEFTLTSDSEHSLSEEALTPRAKLEQEVMRQEWKERDTSEGRGGFTSVRRGSLISTPRIGTNSSDHAEVGEESSKLKFSSKPKSQTVASGDVAKFTCTVSGSSPIDVYWFREGEDDTDCLETGDKYEVSSQDNQHSLEIFFTSAADSGQYLCLAKNDVTSSHWLFGLNVQGSSYYESKAPLFVKELYDTEASIGDTVKLRCKVRAYPAARITWYKDGQRIENSSSPYKLEKFGNRDYVLTILNVTLDDDAEFTISAKNETGEAKSTAQLVVESVDDRRGGGSGLKCSSTSSTGNVSQVNVRRRNNYYALDVQVNGPTPSLSKGIISLKSNSGHTPSPETRSSPVALDEGQATPNLGGTVETLKGNEKKNPASEGHSTFPPPIAISGGVTPLAKEITSQIIQTKTKEVKPRTSLRSAMKGEDANRASSSQVEHSVKITIESSAKVGASKKQISHPQQRHSSSIELDKLTPLQTTTHYTSDKLAASMATVSSPSLDGSAAELSGVDIQPGYVREKQFEQLGDQIIPIRPARRQQKVVETPLPVQSGSAVDITSPGADSSMTESRSEWSQSFPSVKQRRLSLSSTGSVDTPFDHRQGEEHVQSASTPQPTQTKKDLHFYAEGVETSPPLVYGTPELNTKKTVRRVVKRTVSVKRSIIPSTVDSFGDGPPDDGCDYIKVCGKWVKMKTKARDRTASSSPTPALTSPSMSTVMDGDGIPISRAEWGGNISVWKQMKEFKRKQEENGKLITGRNWGPVTSV